LKWESMHALVSGWQGQNRRFDVIAVVHSVGVGGSHLLFVFKRLHLLP
jgi:hypothetical protein